MAYEAQFSWRKILSFFGVAILALAGIVALSQGIRLITISRVFYGILAIIGGVCAYGGAYLLYRNYNKYSEKNNNPKPNYKR